MPGTTTQVQFIVDVVDPDGDWVLGECHFVTGNQLVVPVGTPAPGLPSNATSGTAVCSLVEIFQDETVEIDLTGAGSSAGAPLAAPALLR